MCVNHFSQVNPELFGIPWAVACQIPLSMRLPKQEYWSGLSFPSPGDLSTQGLNLGLLHCRQILYHMSHQGSPIIGDWKAKVGSQEIPRVPGKFSLWIQNEAGQRLTEFCLENALVIANTSSNHTREDSTHGHHQMVNTKIRLIIFFAAKVEKLYIVSKNKTRSWLWLRSWTPYYQIQTQIEESRENR